MTIKQKLILAFFVWVTLSSIIGAALTIKRIISIESENSYGDLTKKWDIINTFFKNRQDEVSFAFKSSSNIYNSIFTKGRSDTSEIHLQNYAESHLFSYIEKVRVLCGIDLVIFVDRQKKIVFSSGNKSIFSYKIVDDTFEKISSLNEGMNVSYNVIGKGVNRELAIIMIFEVKPIEELSFKGGYIICFYQIAKFIPKWRDVFSNSVDITLLVLDLETNERIVTASTSSNVSDFPITNNKFTKDNFYYDSENKILFCRLEESVHSVPVIALSYVASNKKISFSTLINMFIISSAWILTIILGLFVGYYTIKKSVKPLSTLSGIMKRIEKENFKVKIRNEDELGELASPLISALQKIESTISSDKAIIENLSSINAIRKAISSILDSSRLYSFVVNITNDIVPYDKCSLWIKQEDTEDTKSNLLKCVYAISRVSDSKKGSSALLNEAKNTIIDLGLSGIVSVVMEKDELSSKKIDDITPYMVYANDRVEFEGFNSAILIPLSVGNEIVGVIALCRKPKNAFTVKELETMNTFAPHIAIAINNAELYSAMSQKEQMRSELDMARELQRSFLPKSFPKFKGITICADMIPAEDIGGDYYDYIVRDNNDEIGIVVGDVSGKGLPAGIMMATIRMALRAIAPKIPSTKDTLVTLNKIIFENRTSSKFATMIYLIWNSKTKTLKYSGAGHEHILVYHSDSKTTERIRTGGMAINIVPDLSHIIEERCIQLKDGDAVILYSDGATEAQNTRGEMFELSRIEEAVMKGGELGAKGLLNLILHEIYKFIGGTEEHKQFDDITLLVMKIGEKISENEDVDVMDLIFSDMQTTTQEDEIKI